MFNLWFTLYLLGCGVLLNFFFLWVGYRLALRFVADLCQIAPPTGME